MKKYINTFDTFGIVDYQKMSAIINKSNLEIIEEVDNMPTSPWPDLRSSAMRMDRFSYNDATRSVWEDIDNDNKMIEFRKNVAKRLYEFTSDDKLVFKVYVLDYETNLAKVLIVDDMKEKFGKLAEFDEENGVFKITIRGRLYEPTRDIFMDMLKPLDKNFEYLKKEYLPEMHDITHASQLSIVKEYGGPVLYAEKHTSFKYPHYNWINPEYIEDAKIIEDDKLYDMVKDLKIPIMEKDENGVDKCIGWKYRVKHNSEYPYLLVENLNKSNNIGIKFYLDETEEYICHDDIIKNRHYQVDQHRINYYVINKLADYDPKIINTALF